MTESEVIKIFENEVIILDCWIEHCKDTIADCEAEEDEFDDDKERAELSLRDEGFITRLTILIQAKTTQRNKISNGYFHEPG